MIFALEAADLRLIVCGTSFTKFLYNPFLLLVFIYFYIIRYVF